MTDQDRQLDAFLDLERKTTLTDADIQRIIKAISEEYNKNHACVFTPEKAKALSDLADTAVLVKKTSVTMVIKGLFYIIAAMLALGVATWLRKEL